MSENVHDILLWLGWVVGLGVLVWLQRVLFAKKRK
jgi:hypothetical protein